MNPSESYNHLVRLSYHLVRLSYKLICLVGVFLPIDCVCQINNNYRHITEKDGLAYRDVWSVVQSSPGRYWIATAQGLQMYDGHHFFSLKELCGSDPIKGQLVYNLQMHEDSLLYFNIRNGVYKLNTNSLKLHEHFVPDANKGELTLYYKYGNEEYWVKTYGNSAKLYSNKKDVIDVIDSSNYLVRIGSGFRVYRYNDYLVWGSNNIGLRVININDDKLINSLFSNNNNYVFETDESSNIYISSEDDQISMIKPPYSNPPLEIALSQNHGIHFVGEANGNKVWVKGETLFTIDEFGTIEYYDEYLSKLSIKNIRAIYTDPQSNTWLATFDGLIIIPRNVDLFKTFHKSMEVGVVNEMRGINKDSIGNLYIQAEGTSNKIYRVNDSEVQFTESVRGKDGKKLRGWRAYYPLVYDERFGKHWVFTGIYKLGLIDLSTGIYEQFLDVEEEPFIKLKSGELLMGKQLYRLTQYDPIKNTKRYIEYDFPVNEKGFINSFLELDDGLIMVSSLDGIYIVSLEGKIIKHLDTESNPSLPHNNVSMMSKAKDGTYWGATKGGGMFSLSNDLQTVKIFGIKEGLPNLWLPQVLPVDDTTIVGPTFSGLSILDLHSNSFRNYYEEHGLSHNEFNTNSYLLTDSLLYLGTLNGLNVLDLKNLKAGDEDFSLHISLIKKYNRITDSIIHYKECDLLNDGINLSPNDSWVEIYIAVSDMLNPSKNIYKYKIENYHTEWQTMMGKGLIRIEGIPPGDYTILIKGYNLSNVPCSNEIKLPLKIEQVFYKSNWFLALLSLFIGAIGLFWYRRIKGENKRLEKTVQERTAIIRNDKETIEKQSEELLALDEMKNQFFANISHELRTPLTLLLSPLQQLQKGQLSSDKQTYLMQLMQDNGKLLQDRIDEMLELSRLEAKEVRLARQTLSLYELIDFSTRIFQPKADDKKIKYEVKQSHTNITVVCDERRLSKIIQNIINNAIKFTPSEGEVSCTFIYENEHLLMDFKDSGSGIKQVDIDKIFHRFFQVKVDNTMANPGTGIGLSMVKEYVDLMGGDIKVESELNRGSRFIISLPLEQTSNIDADSIDYPELTVAFDFIPLPQKNKPVLLIVEDNNDLRSYVKTLLVSYFTIIEAENGRVALDILDTSDHKIDVILSDIMMPEMDGIALLSKVRSHDDWKLIPFIFLTAKHNEEDIIKAYKLGVDDYIKKPFAEEQLLCRLNAVYQNYKVRIESANEIIEPDEKVLQEMESDSIQELKTIILENLGTNYFSMNFLAEKMKVSKRTLLRLVKKEVGMTPVDFVKEIKLNTARRILETESESKIEKVMVDVGFTDKRYFKKLYYERFGSKLLN